MSKLWGLIFRIAIILAIPALASCKDETKNYTVSDDAKIDALEIRINALENLLEGVSRTDDGFVVPGLVFTDQDIFDYVAKSVVEGIVFISPPGLTGDTAFINGNNARLCSSINNSGYNVGHRFKVYLSNNDVSGLARGQSIDEVNEDGISVYCLDSLRGSENLELILNSSGTDIEEYIDSAEIYITHTSGDLNTIKIEAVEVSHRLSFDILSDFELVVTDNRSQGSRDYKVNTDERHGYFKR